MRLIRFGYLDVCLPTESRRGWIREQLGEKLILVLGPCPGDKICKIPGVYYERSGEACIQATELIHAMASHRNQVLKA